MEVVISIIIAIISLAVSILAYIQPSRNNKFTQKLELERRKCSKEKE